MFPDRVTVPPPERTRIYSKKVIVQQYSSRSHRRIIGEYGDLRYWYFRPPIVGQLVQTGTCQPSSAAVKVIGSWPLSLSVHRQGPCYYFGNVTTRGTRLRFVRSTREARRRK